LRRYAIFWLLCLGFVLRLSASAVRADTTNDRPGETVQQAACRNVESAAHDTGLSVELLTRLIWVESRFQPTVISRVGAQGIAQFMRTTAAERGLFDPYDPEQAIPQAAKLLVHLEQQFGNIGLAIAAYNAGSTRVANWLAGAGTLPKYTPAFVLALTGRTPEDWAATGQAQQVVDGSSQSCIHIMSMLRDQDGAAQGAISPWGIQLAGNFSKALALAAFDRVRKRLFSTVVNLQPMVIGTRRRGCGMRKFYRVVLAASSRAEADLLCRAIFALSGSCVALRL
jgi:transglycosylase-like protein with SLT domain